MNIDGEELSPENKADRFTKMFEEAVNVERNIVRRCTEIDAPHYFFNVPVSARPRGSGINISGNNMRYWLLNDYTSCVFSITDRTTDTIVENNNNFVFTRLSNIEEFTQRPEASTVRDVTAVQRIGRKTENRNKGFFDFDFKNFELGINDREQCTLPGLTDASSISRQDSIDLRLFPSIRIVGPPQMYTAPGIWGYVHTFLYMNRGAQYTMLIKDVRTNNSVCLFSNYGKNYIFVPKKASSEVNGEFTLVRIKQHEHNDHFVMERIRSSGAFKDIKRTAGSGVYFMRSFTSVEDNTHYEPPCDEKTASEEFYASGQRVRRMAHHTFADGSSPGSICECIGDYVRIGSARDREPGVFGSMDGILSHHRVKQRIDLLRTRTTSTGVATHGVEGMFECWYCGQRVRTIPNLDVEEDRLNFSYLRSSE